MFWVMSRFSSPAAASFLSPSPAQGYSVVQPLPTFRLACVRPDPATTDPGGCRSGQWRQWEMEGGGGSGATATLAAALAHDQF
ncbi:hypothetical protein E2562_024583 [Oryza meyeriana var. granulata]|uniref:Uncharacterized protein n=1 Tax=Oryza meyeriana var. granulata TaxID=110450 RepID=A0A6G1CSP5_9ORYZ|nr:hypothetical protein E2562_024583 [Oryza meyeriana var. granulata]